jgi:VanZ family protein
MVLITILSLVSFEDNESLDIRIPHFDKIVHFTFYFTASVLGALFARDLYGRRRTKLPVLTVLFFGLLGYGIIIEVLQSTFTSYRSGEILDILANSAGALLGIMLMWALFSGKTGLKWEN